MHVLLCPWRFPSPPASYNVLAPRRGKSPLSLLVGFFSEDKRGLIFFPAPGDRAAIFFAALANMHFFPSPWLTFFSLLLSVQNFLITS